MLTFQYFFIVQKLCYKKICDSSELIKLQKITIQFKIFSNNNFLLINIFIVKGRYCKIKNIIKQVRDVSENGTFYGSILIKLGTMFNTKLSFVQLKAFIKSFIGLKSHLFLSHRKYQMFKKV